jgi:GntR family transcriptional regulator
VIDARGDAALYQRVADDLANRVERGEFPPGAELPAEPDLAGHYGVGKDTVRAALAELRSEGLIVTQRGYRAKVVDASEKTDLWIDPDDVVESRPPTRRERRQLAADGKPVLPGWPVLHVMYADGTGDLFPAHLYRIRVRGGSGS